MLGNNLNLNEATRLYELKNGDFNVLPLYQNNIKLLL